MAGGAGTRFWPVSTEERPKQFLNLFGGKSLLEQSYDRVAGLVPDERILVLTSQRLTRLVAEQLPRLPECNVIGEPLRRDTAAAVALAATLCRRRWGNPVMVILTADHLIRPVELFRRTILSAARAAVAEPVLYTFGIVPSYPATCYGYLDSREKVAEDDGIGHFRLRRFVEKPDAETARKYLAAGNFYWNSGMFVWSVETILAELARQLPAHLEHLVPAVEHDSTPEFAEALRRAFEPLTATSIDFGVMEGAKNIRMLRAEFEWNDVGGWLALEEFLAADPAGNVHRGRLEAIDAAGNLVFCEDESETVALIGVKDLVVVRASGKTLVVPKERAEEIKKLVKKLNG
jgi:mannose-1-phosphate guanylyltransferase